MTDIIPTHVANRPAWETFEGPTVAPRRPCYLGPQGWQHEPTCPEYVDPTGRRAYAVQAQRMVPNSRRFGSLYSDAPRAIPTFYLLADVQGITSLYGAERVARDIIGRDLIEGSLSIVETTLP